MAEHLKLIKPEAPPVPSGLQAGFVATEAAQHMLLTLNAVAKVQGFAVTMIAAAPGTGKTETLWHYRMQHRRSFVCTAVSGEGGVWGAARAVMSLFKLGMPNGRDLPEARAWIAEAVGPGGLLIWDEAQYLVQRNNRGKDNFDAFEWLRFAAEEGDFGLVFVGDLKLVDAVADLPQLRRRLRRPVVIRRVSKADVRIFARARGLDDPRMIDALAAVAAAHGGLGDVANVIAHARDCAAGTPLDLSHVLFAIEDLKLAPKGGRG